MDHERSCKKHIAMYNIAFHIDNIATLLLHIFRVKLQLNWTIDKLYIKKLI